MISDKSVLVDDYKARIRNELQSLIQAPLSYDTTNLINLLDDFEQDPNLNLNDYTITQAAIHLASYLVSLDFINAKHLWNRLSENYQKDEKIKSILAILKAGLQDDYANLIPIIQTAEKAYSGSEDIKNLLGALIPVFRAHIIKKITRDFVNIPLKDVAKFLSLEYKNDNFIITSTEVAKSQLLKKGWKMHDENLIQTPKNLEISDKEFRMITEAQFKNLTQTISFLETI